MKTIASILCVVVVALTAAAAGATDRLAIAVEGSYLLLQDDNYQRILTFDRGGNVSQVSDQQPLLGFTVGQGAWEQTGPDSVTAKVVDFAYDPKDGHLIGPSVIVYSLTFGDQASGAYQTVTGSYAGEQYAEGQNPLDPTDPPISTFGIEFKGQRITAK